MNIYLDIDGVLVTSSLDSYSASAPFALEFLEYITKNHDCFWLTTHCKGNAADAVDYVKKELGNEYEKHLLKIQPTNWNSWKTEAIDFSKDFRWIDDEAYEPELQKLGEQQCRDKLIRVSLQENPNQLREIIKLL